MSRPATHLTVLSALTLILLCASAPRSEEIQIVRNVETGLWGGDSTKSLNFSTDLVIGKEDGDENEILGRIFGIAVNSTGDIYILDNGFTRVQRYDSTGSYQQTIGREGEGPGEFYFPTAIAIDESDHLYVAGRNRVSIFDANGNYVDEFRHGIPGSFVRSICVDAKSGIFISCFDVYEQQIIHKYSFEHDLLFSFCDSYAAGQEIDVRIESTYAGGVIDVDDEGVIYFTQMTPYEIRKFSPSGDLLSVIYRENSFIKEPQVEMLGDGVIRMGAFAGSSSIVVLNDKKFINVVKLPPLSDGTAETIVDLFDNEGNLLISRRFNRNINVRCADGAGRLYAVDMEGYPKVVRYLISYGAL